MFASRKGKGKGKGKRKKEKENFYLLFVWFAKEYNPFPTLPAKTHPSNNNNNNNNNNNFY